MTYFNEDFIPNRVEEPSTPSYESQLEVIEEALDAGVITGDEALEFLSLI